MKHQESQSRTNESQLKKQRVLQWKCLDLNVNKQVIWHQNAVLQFTFIVKHNRDSKKYVLLSKNLENSHINHTNSVFYKNGILWSIDRSLRPTRKHKWIFLVPQGFLWVRDAGHRGIKIPAWGLRDWRNICVRMTGLKNSKANPPTRFNWKKNWWKNIIPHRNNNSQTTPRPPVIRKPTILGQVYRHSSGHESNSPYWAKTGQCDKNPDWMLVNCKKSCSSKIKDSNPSCPARAKLWECKIIPNGCCQTASWAACALSAKTEWGEIMIWLFIIILTVH